MSPVEIYNDPNATPRDRALAACELGKYAGTPALAWEWAARAAALAREEAGITDADLLFGQGDWPSFARVEARLNQIKYTCLVLEMPTEAVERLMSLPEWIKAGLGIVGIRLPEEENKG